MCPITSDLMEVDPSSTPPDSTMEVELADLTASVAGCSLLDTPKSRGKLFGSSIPPPKRVLFGSDSKKKLSLPKWTESELKSLTGFIKVDWGNLGHSYYK